MKKSLFELRSERRCKAIKKLVEGNEWSVGYGLEKLETLFDEEKVTEANYTELAEWLEEQMQPEIVENEPATEQVDEQVEE